MKLPMKPFQRLAAVFILLSLLLLGACQNAPQPKPQQVRPPILVLVSIDGFRADYLDLGITPTIAAVAGEGVRAKAMRPSFPSLTFPNHYSIVTGLRPDRHGVVHNTMRDPDIPGITFSLSNREAVADAQWWNDGEPLWNTASRQGLRTATMFWPGSEAPIHDRWPDLWKPFQKDMPSMARVEQVVQWLDLPQDQRPDFITLYFDEVDTQGHYHGPDSAQVYDALRSVDAALARLVEGMKERGLYDSTNLVILSDHGMAERPDKQMVALDDYVDGDLFEIFSASPIIGIAARPGREEAMDEAFANTRIPHAQCWRRDQLPERFHFGTHRRVPRWVCMAEEGWGIANRAIVAMLAGREKHLGAHGFDPELPSMAALFVAHGPDFQRGLVVDGFDNVDVYPLMARLLRIQPEENDGDPAATQSLMRD